MLFLTACLIYWSFFSTFKVEQNISFSIFLLINLSLLAVSAAGYLINDKHDIQTDAINQKTKKHISLLNSPHFKKLYFGLLITGFISGSFISIIYSNWFALFSYFFAVVTLHFYNSHLKKRLLLGNLATSLLISLAILIYPSFEIDLLNFESHPTRILYFFALSSFLINLVREIIKDMEDIKGDYAIGLDTLPILIGKERSKNISFFIMMISSIVSILFYTFYFLQNAYLLFSAYLFVIIPSVIIAYLISQSKFKKDYSRISFALKIHAGFGLLSILLFHWF
ncbi:UbiA family prenyltransferase [Psychroflexus halocasei]|uniref:4-hydroxybenzoate polyprenyltransferase n=1 Tax=Psychroflexus halocasei TaxID=908615 RepID=A0A1H3ZSU8_9FLAO|nr:UbiA family prenyltransferase [Psychroflexus halocasei]SEA26833.1 4-hydroxybenzoate polyprenyltransferase [Psychroflexus halocasei]